MLGGGRPDRTKDTEASWIHLRVERNLQNWKYLYPQIPIQQGKTSQTMVWKKPNFPKIPSKETLAWK